MLFKHRKNKVIEEGRKGLYTMTDKDKEAAILMLSAEPIYSYLMSIVDEKIRQGVYLPYKEQEAVKMFVDIIGNEIAKGKELRKKQEREKQLKK